MRASDIIAEVAAPLTGLPVFIAGSLVAEHVYGKTNAHDDADVFCSTQQAFFVSVQRCLSAGFTIIEKHERLWQRWLKTGFKGWHTNSIKMRTPSGIEINFVFKMVDGHATTSLSQVLESFDFGLLAAGYTLDSGLKFFDLRTYLFPGMDVDGPLPLMPNKADDWANGFISRYNGMREPGRYAKYTKYGYDMSLVQPTLVAGYNNIALYNMSKDTDEGRQLAEIYFNIAEHIQYDRTDELIAANKTILFTDSLDEIMAALE
jgi:hypothetical protein